MGQRYGLRKICPAVTGSEEGERQPRVKDTGSSEAGNGLQQTASGKMRTSPYSQKKLNSVNNSSEQETDSPPGPSDGNTEPPCHGFSL